jgi:hypothetical protein
MRGLTPKSVIGLPSLLVDIWSCQCMSYNEEHGRCKALATLRRKWRRRVASLDTIEKSSQEFVPVSFFYKLAFVLT